MSDTNVEVLPPPEKPWLWKAGAPSPNPLGQNANPERRMVVEAARRYSVEAIATLYDLMKDSKSEAIKAMCANMILDRAFGKPKQMVEVEDQGRTLESILRAIAAAREARQAGETEAKPSENP